MGEIKKNSTGRPWTRSWRIGRAVLRRRQGLAPAEKTTPPNRRKTTSTTHRHWTVHILGRTDRRNRRKRRRKHSGRPYKKALDIARTHRHTHGRTCVDDVGWNATGAPRSAGRPSRAPKPHPHPLSPAPSSPARPWTPSIGRRGNYDDVIRTDVARPALPSIGRRGN